MGQLRSKAGTPPVHSGGRHPLTEIKAGLQQRFVRELAKPANLLGLYSAHGEGPAGMPGGLRPEGARPECKVVRLYRKRNKGTSRAEKVWQIKGVKCPKIGPQEMVALMDLAGFAAR